MYYETDTVQENELRGIIPLSGASVEARTDNAHVNHDFQFEILTSTAGDRVGGGGRAYQLRALHNDEMEEWIKNLRSVIDGAKSRRDGARMRLMALLIATEEQLRVHRLILRICMKLS